MSGYTQEQLQTLRQAVAGGVRSVTFADGKKVEYGSVGEMLRLIGVIERDLMPASQRATHVNPTFCKGV